MGAATSRDSREKQLAKMFAIEASRPTDTEALNKLKKLLPSPDPQVANAKQPDDAGGRTVLMVVVSLRMGKAVGDYLIANGADVTAADPSGYTVLHWAAMKDDEYFVTKALDAGVGINQLTNGKQTALMFACKYQSVKVFKLLMDRGADASISEPVGNMTALAYAKEVLQEADDDDERARAQEMISRLEAK